MITTEIDVASVLEAMREIVPLLRKNGNETEDRWWIRTRASTCRTRLVYSAWWCRAVRRSRTAPCRPVPRACRDCTRVRVDRLGRGGLGVECWMATLYPDRAEEIFADDSIRVSGGSHPQRPSSRPTATMCLTAADGLTQEVGARTAICSLRYSNGPTPSRKRSSRW
jgi:hypothetical protein